MNRNGLVGNHVKVELIVFGGGGGGNVCETNVSRCFEAQWPKYLDVALSQPHCLHSSFLQRRKRLKM